MCMKIANCILTAPSVSQMSMSSACSNWTRRPATLMMTMAMDMASRAERAGQDEDADGEGEGVEEGAAAGDGTITTR